MDPEEHRRLLRELPLPEPAIGIDLYVAERERALAVDPRRKANYDKYLAWKRDGGRVTFLPIKLDIENVSRCNFRCKMCIVSDWDKGRRSDDMTLDAFMRLLDEQYGVFEIKLQGIGEPTMAGDLLFEMIRYARAKSIWVRTTTNASLLHLRDNYKKMIDSGANEIQISIDGASQESFETIRRGSDFERVMSNCKLINDYGRSVSWLPTKMWTVIQRDNHHELEKLVDLARELGFSNLVFMVNLLDWGVDKWHRTNEALQVEDRLDPRRLHGLIERGRKLGVSVRFWNASDKYLPGTRNGLCPWPFERAYVSSDMRVVPCCMIGNPEVYEIGRGLDHGFSAVWLGAEYDAFRNAHLTGDIPKVCRNCYHAETHWPKAGASSRSEDHPGSG